MSEKLWEDQCKFLRAELAQVQASRQQLDEAHKEASHRLLHSEAELAQCRGELAEANAASMEYIERTDRGQDELAAKNERLAAERDTLKSEVERLKGDVAEADRIAQSAAETEQQTANRASRIEQHCLNLSKALTSHRLLLDELGKALRIAHDAMVTWFSSEYADSEKAKIVRRALDNYYAALTKYQQQCGEKVKV